MKKPEPYDEERCKNCPWCHQCDEGHFLCLFANCMRIDAPKERKNG